MIEQQKLKPVNWRILVEIPEEKKEEKKSAGGIILTDSAAKDEERGQLKSGIAVEVADNCETIKQGMKVFFIGNNGYKAGKNLRLMNEDDIVAYEVTDA